VCRAGTTLEASRSCDEGRQVKVAYYGGRLGQLIGMWLLLVDLFTAGPMGPNPRIFGLGVIIFLGGWGLTRLTR
jgi:hypothetical protein